MDRDSFTVSDKYKGKYDELGKILSLRAYFLFFFFLNNSDNFLSSDHPFFTIPSSII